MKKQLQNNRFYGGYYLFIKDRRKLTDDDALNLLDITNKELSKEDNKKDCFDYSSPKVYITETGDWKHLIDNYCYYALNHLSKINVAKPKDIILELAKRYEVFEAFISDIDKCFYYKYYHKGRLCRYYSVEPIGSSYSKNFVAVDRGITIGEEKEILKKNCQDDKVLDIASIYGVEIFHEIKNIRCYNIGV